MRPKDQWYYSERGIPLVFHGNPPDEGSMILTVENYLKWYHIYRIMPDGSVLACAVNSETVSRKMGYGGTTWSDHVPHPQYCVWLMKWMRETFNCQVDWCSESFEMIVGRYMIEQKGEFEEYLE